MSSDIDVETPKDLTAPQMLPSWNARSQQNVGASMIAPFDAPDSSTKNNGTTAQHLENGQKNAIEKLVGLKNELREADTDVFWKRLMEGMTAICNAQAAFLLRKTLKDESDGSTSGADTPSLPEEHDGIRVYYNPTSFDSSHGDCVQDLRTIPRRLVASDKVCLISEGLRSTMGDSSQTGNACPIEAYLAVPLFSAGKCFAHFGLMWTTQGLELRDVSWAYLEMMLHSLEDLILLRVLTENNTSKKNGYYQRHRRRRTRDLGRKGNPNNAAPASTPYQPPPIGSPSFKPYARSLSHELRTPMQGVVGMLDVMHATVQETIETKPESQILSTFEELRDNIEAVQDSARRAIEAADNVVHAYDLNMQVPDTPQVSSGDDSQPRPSRRPWNGSAEHRPNILVEGTNISVNSAKRSRPPTYDWNHPRSAKAPRTEGSPYGEISARTADVKSVVEESDKIVHATPQQQMEEVLIDAVAQNPQLAHERAASPAPRSGPVFPPMVLQHTRIRDLLHLVITESLHVGGRPDSIVAEPTDLGERIEIRSTHSNGRSATKVIEWSVDPSVPETLFFDEKDLAKLVSCLFLNAVKFTEAGHIAVRTTLGPEARHTQINISDTGTGIPETFLPRLFQAFAREDGSTTRSKEGLGLGLLVAKGLSRRLGGDLTCVRSSTTGPDRGSEFEIRLPMNPNECVSRPSTPNPGTPAPSPVNSSSYISAGSGSSTDPSQTSSEQSRTSSTGDEPSATSVSSSQPNPEVPDAAKQNTNTSRSNGANLLGATGRLSLASKGGASFFSGRNFDKGLAQKKPLTFLVAEDNIISRRVLVNMLGKLGYKDIYEAFDGKEAVRIMGETLSSDYTTPAISVDTGHSASPSNPPTTKTESNGPLPATNHRRKSVDVILMDLWMPEMDGYEATERILHMVNDHRRHITEHDQDASPPPGPTVLAVSADVTEEALRRAITVGIEGYLTKPYRVSDLGKLITELCGKRGPVK